MRQAAIALKVPTSQEQQPFDPAVISAPVTLGNPLKYHSTFLHGIMTHLFFRHIVSIGTTIWSLGELYTGKGRSKYWSGRGVCMKWTQYGNIT